LQFSFAHLALANMAGGNAGRAIDLFYKMRSARVAPSWLNYKHALQACAR
jgi:hypothetical protein